VLWSKIGHMGTTCQASLLCKMAWRPRWCGRPVTPCLGWARAFCDIISSCHIVCDFLILDIMKICMDFGPYGAFPSSDVPEMVDQQNSLNSLVIGTYHLYLEWNVGMLAVNICILWLPTPPHLEFSSSLSKRKELNPGDISKNSSTITARE
jgi:hypothetical protein